MILADWLEDNGQPSRAEFIRVQCRLARLDTRNPAYPDLHLHQLALLAEHEREWLGEWADRLVRWEFRRGLLSSITVQPEAFAHAGPFFADHPVDRVAFVNGLGESLAPEAVRDVLSRPHIGHVRVIETSGCRAEESMAAMFGGEIATSSWLRELARATHVQQLQEISFFGGTRSGREAIEPVALAEFCSARHLGTLARLDLGNCYDSEWLDEWPPLLRILASAAFAPNLRGLRLDGCMLADDAAAILATSGAFSGLEELSLGGCDFIRNGGIQAILDSPYLTNLRDVMLPYGADLRSIAACPRLAGWHSFGLSGDASGTSIGRAVATEEWEAMVSSPNLRPASLTIRAHVRFPPSAAQILASAPWVPLLERLHLSFRQTHASPFTDLFTEREVPLRLRSVYLGPTSEFFPLLLAWPGLAGLTELAIDHLDSVAPLLESPFLSPALARLDVSGSCRTRDDIAILPRSKGLCGLLHLGFGYNSLNGPKMAALAASPSFRHLESLHLGSESDYRREEEGAVIDALRILIAPENFPRLRDVVVGSETDPEGIELLRMRFGPRLRVWCDC